MELLESARRFLQLGRKRPERRGSGGALPEKLRNATKKDQQVWRIISTETDRFKESRQPFNYDWYEGTTEYILYSIICNQTLPNAKSDLVEAELLDNLKKNLKKRWEDRKIDFHSDSEAVWLGERYGVVNRFAKDRFADQYKIFDFPELSPDLLMSLILIPEPSEIGPQ